MRANKRKYIKFNYHPYSPSRLVNYKQGNPNTPCDHIEMLSHKFTEVGLTPPPVGG